jgi:uncharacterized protein
MVNSIFVNLPVKDLAKSVEFFGKLGFTFNAQFTDKTATCMIIAEPSIYAMLLTHAKFKEFTAKDIVDSKKATEVLNAFGVESRAAVDAMVDAAIAAGGTSDRRTADYGFMYQRSLDDLDGHTGEVLWMDPAHIQ